MKILFVSGNRDKIKEAGYILTKFNIGVKGIQADFKELVNSTLEDIVIDKAKQINRIIKEPFIVDDAGIFFEAYHNFPGVFTKYIFKVLGYDGISRLLEGKNLKAYFKTAIAYRDPKGKILLFKGICKGAISPVVRGSSGQFSPFNSLFIPNGENRTFAELGLKNQIEISHRAKALEKFARYFIKNFKKE